jgi:hypothetical protein
MLHETLVPAPSGVSMDLLGGAAALAEVDVGRDSLMRLARRDYLAAGAECLRFPSQVSLAPAGAGPSWE